MPLKQIKGLSTTVVVLLAIQIVFIGAEAFALLRRISLLNRIQSGDFSSTSQVSGADAAVDTTSGIVSVLFITTIVFWCVWQHHAQFNAARFTAGPPLRFTPGWAVGWWFIPIANLWKPFQALRELWKASHGGDAWRVLRTWPMIGWWWGVWIASNIHVWWGSSGGSMSFGTTPNGTPVTPANVVIHDSWELVSIVLTVVAAILAISIVRTITDLQQRLASSWLPSVPIVLATPTLPPPMPPPPAWR